jgi:hypothetical protein
MPTSACDPAEPTPYIFHGDCGPRTHVSVIRVSGNPCDSAGGLRAPLPGRPQNGPRNLWFSTSAAAKRLLRLVWSSCTAAQIALHISCHGPEPRG